MTMIIPAVEEDLPDILCLQYRAFRSEAVLLGVPVIPPLTQSLDGLREEFKRGVVLKAVGSGRILGSVRAFREGGTSFIGRLFVDPLRRGEGIGSLLMAEVERCAHAPRYELFTSGSSHANIRLYERLGYTRFREERVSARLELVYFEKRRRLE